MQMQGCGYGDDGPLLNHRFTAIRARDLVIQSGNVFVWKPLLMTADQQLSFTWGAPLLVTDHGCETLFKRAHGMVAIV